MVYVLKSFLVVMAGFLYVFAQSQPISPLPVSPDSAKLIDSATSAFGSVRFLSEPESAEVFIDNNPIGFTPVMVEKISVGKHDVVIKKEGYFSKKASVLIETNASGDVSFSLSKPGILKVGSEPVGAEVILDGKRVGTTPVVLDKIRAGEYKLELNLSGYSSISKTVTVAAGVTDTLTLSLQALQIAPVVKPAPSAKPSVPVKTDKKVMAWVIAIFSAFCVAILYYEVAHS